MALNWVSEVPIKAKPTRLMYFLLTHLPPMCDQAHPVQLGQPTLFTDVKTRDSLL